MSESLLQLLTELVAIPSVNPALDEAATGEAEVAAYIEAWCRARGLQTRRQEVFPGRDNLLIELRAGKPDTLLLEAHMDTVPAGAMPDALRPIAREGQLYGRGACDTKGSLAAMLWALGQAAATPETLACDVVLCCAVDEEHGARGIRAFLELGLSLSGAVVGEPTQLRVVVAHKGCARFAVETRGRAAHSSVPEEGDSAIMQMLEVLRFARDEAESLRDATPHPLCGTPSLVVGTIRGGTQVNIVPERCEIEIDRRLVPGEYSRAMLDDFTARLSRATQGLGVQFSMRELLMDPPLNTSPDAEISLCAQRAARHLGLDETLTGVPFGSDASKLGEAGVPCLVFGPGSIAQAHAAQEFVPLTEVETAMRFYSTLMQTFAPSNAGAK